jgi:peptidoglycan/xylan/chitin deacetylase (PgdA/CDA1 family)
VDSLDWDKSITGDQIIQRIMKRVTPGAIILFHNDTRYTAEILDDVIRMLKSEGYGFLPVSEMILKEKFYIDHTGRQIGN